MNSNGANFASKMLITGFLIMISLPLISRLLQLGSGTITSENRAIKNLPAFQFSFHSSFPSTKSAIASFYRYCVRYIDKFDQAYSDTFGFRAELLDFYFKLKLSFFHSEPLPRKVVQGMNGWFFLGDSYSNVIKESKGIENFSNEDLRTCLEKTQEKQSWLDSKNIRFYVAVAPNKLSVYGDQLAIKKSEKVTQVDQINALSLNSFNFIDLKAKFGHVPQIRLFHKTDSHWNDYGAFLGYSTLMEKIQSDFPEVPVPHLTDFLVDTVSSTKQDLTNMLSLRIPEEVVKFRPKQPGKAELQPNKLTVPKNYDRTPEDYEKRYTSKVNDLKVLVLHDSFTTALIPFMKESFGETVFIWKPNFNKSVIEQEKPDIVIQIVVERSLELLKR